MNQVPAPPSIDGFEPTQADVDGVLDWWAEYDRHVVDKNVEAMADMGLFPINEVTDGSARYCTREEFIHGMTEIVGHSEDVTMESTRTPHFLNQNLVFVITDAAITAGGQTTKVRYGDVLVKCDGRWLFQTMIQGGWGAA